MVEGLDLDAGVLAGGVVVAAGGLLFGERCVLSEVGFVEVEVPILILGGAALVVVPWRKLPSIPLLMIPLKQSKTAKKASKNSQIFFQN